MDGKEEVNSSMRLPMQPLPVVEQHLVFHQGAFVSHRPRLGFGIDVEFRLITIDGVVPHVAT